MNDTTRAQALLMHPGDDVALAAVDLAAGAAVQVAGVTIILRQDIPFGHKFALRPIPACAEVRKYGECIGRAVAAIAAGEHVHVHNVESLRGRGDLAEGVGRTEAAAPGAAGPDGGETRAGVAESPQANLAGQATEGVRAHQADPAVHPGSPAATFLGYRRSDGRAGVRNHVLVLSTVQCADGVVTRLGRELPEVIAVSHPWGCSQIGADLAQTRRVLAEFAGHPNVAATLLVGLGCETILAAELAAELAGRGLNVRSLVIQDEGGNRGALAAGLAICRELVAAAGRAHREPIPLSELIVGLECGGSDSWSGITANPALGAASDLLVAAGATVILSEVPEFIGAEHLLAARAADPAVAGQIVAACARYEAEARRMGADLRGAQPSPGNIAGGLTTIEEKSLGAITKGGTTTVQQFLPYGLRPTRRGLTVMDTPGNDPESVTGMVAGGAQVVVFTTGRGTPAGCPIAPVVKVASNTAMYRRLHEDLDLDAGPVLDGEPLPAAGQRIFDAVLVAANGAPTASETWGAREFAINIIGPRL